MGFSGDFIHSFLRSCLSWDRRMLGFSCFRRGRLTSSKAVKAAFIRRSGCRSRSLATLPEGNSERHASETPPCRHRPLAPLSPPVSATKCIQNNLGDKAENPVILPLPTSNTLHRTTGQGTCPVLAVKIETHGESLKRSQFWGRECLQEFLVRKATPSMESAATIRPRT